MHRLGGMFRHDAVNFERSLDLLRRDAVSPADLTQRRIGELQQIDQLGALGRIGFSQQIDQLVLGIGIARHHSPPRFLRRMSRFMKYGSMAAASSIAARLTVSAACTMSFSAFCSRPMNSLRAFSFERISSASMAAVAAA